MMLEYKNYQGEVKSVDRKEGIIAGYFSSTGNVDLVGDIIEPGAYSKTLKERKGSVYFLYQHDPTKILGIPHVLKEDEFGLYFESKLTRNPLGQEVLTYYEEGLIKYHSIGFNTIKADYKKSKDGDPIRVIKELKLWEGSAVTFPANPNTPVVAIKSEKPEAVLEILKTHLDKIEFLIRKGATNEESITDLCELWRLQAVDLIDALKQTEPIEEITPVEVEPQVDESVATIESLRSIRDYIKSQIN